MTLVTLLVPPLPRGLRLFRFPTRELVSGPSPPPALCTESRKIFIFGTNLAIWLFIGTQS